MGKLTLHRFDEHVTTDDPTKRWHSLKGAIPFVALVVFIACAGGIFYAAEHGRIYQPLDDDKTSIRSNTPSSTSNDNSSANSFKNNVSYWACVHFVATTITTIGKSPLFISLGGTCIPVSLNALAGYGDVVARTIPGQILAIFFALTGTPLLLVCLSQLGRWLEHILNTLWIKLSDRFRLHVKHHADSDVPLSLGITVTLLWILLSSLYFYFTLKPMYDKSTFNYFTACYFAVITFLTIGYGDVSPSNYQLVIPTFIFVFIGLALVTMCIDIMQTKMENMFDNVTAMIEGEYKKSVTYSVDGKPRMATDSALIEKNVKDLLKNTGDGKFFGALFNSRQKDRLVEQYKKQANKVNKGVQATVNMQEYGTQMEFKKEGNDVALQVYRPVWQRRLPTVIMAKTTVADGMAFKRKLYR